MTESATTGFAVTGSALTGSAVTGPVTTGPTAGSPTAGPAGIPFDRITEVSPGRRAVAVRHVPHTLDVLDTHFPRFPVLPGVLILDALAHTAELALPADGARRWTPAEARRLRFRHYVTPGDRLELTVDIEEIDGDTARCRGTARVDGRTVTTVRELLLVRSGGTADGPEGAV
ncbi:3-hydroxyacyl-ACP dehydratase FabZ family protein [Streptomyces sp. NPDC018031]|uniref:3-hydroxyacyl-ACP dehydratase FabZ family protein n=1 Tax=Streptomyces sp. NPDC018031 TaxID=3365033 RepID=UPI0037A3510B